MEVVIPSFIFQASEDHKNGLKERILSVLEEEETTHSPMNFEVIQFLSILSKELIYLVT